MWESDFQKLNNGDQENFRKLCNLLLAKTFVIRDFYDKKEKRMRIHADYRFAERHLSLFQEYLSFAGWSLYKDNTYGVIYIKSVYGYNRMALSKFATLVLLTLRLIFEENREEVSLKNEVIIQANALIQKMITLNLLEKKPSYKELTDVMRLLAQHNVVDKLSGKWDEPDTLIIIHPSIIFIIPNDKMSDLNKMLTQEEEPEGIIETTELFDINEEETE